MRIETQTIAFFRSIAGENNPEWKPINSITAANLFKEHSVMFREIDGIPIPAACRIFGYVPILKVERDNIARMAQKKEWYVIPVDVADGKEHKLIRILTWAGFKECVTICNVEAHITEGKKLQAALESDLAEEDRILIEEEKKRMIKEAEKRK